MIDVAEVTFACSTLANFVAQVNGAVPQASLAVVRGTPMICSILTVTGVNRHLTNDAGPHGSASNSQAAGRSRTTS